ncbi:MAG: phage baseplate protein [candidate division WOR-3 bacterium]|nr:phage baseplate protein [candidate division WOR-3 bacterium]
MRGLTAQDILAVWEAGQDQHPVDRALTVLEHGFPDLTRERSARLPLGQRDRLLLELRAKVFGDVMTASARCPGCGEQLEIPIAVSAISGQRSAVSGRQSAVSRQPSAVSRQRSAFSLRSGKYAVRFRLPDSRDQAAAAVSPDPAAARRALLERCVISVRHGKQEVRPSRLPETTVSALAGRMEDLDPMAELAFDLTCPQCGNQWEEVLDPAGFFWAELAMEAQRLLSEVHTLAQAYGWREQDILALGARRRQHYLGLAGS